MIVEYDATGMITHIVNDPVPPGLVDLMRERGRTLIELIPDYSEDGAGAAEVDLIGDYVDVDTQEIKKRPVVEFPAEITLAIGDSYKIENLPDPLSLVIDSRRYEITGGELELEGEMPAEYFIYVDSFPYYPSRIKVVVA